MTEPTPPVRTGSVSVHPPVTPHEPPGRGGAGRIFSFVLPIIALVLAANAGVALWIGLQDALSPLSLSVRLVGLFYVVAGLLSVVGLMGVYQLERSGFFAVGSDIATLRRQAKLRGRNGHSGVAQPLARVGAGSAAGLYVDLTIVYYSVHYKTSNVFVFGLLALLCAYWTLSTLPVIWMGLGKELKAAGISIAVIGAAAQFWYSSIYVPENTPVGMEYTFGVGPAASTGAKIVQFNFTWQVAGSVPAIDLNSMLVVSGINYPNDRSVVLRVTQPIQDNSFVFPGDRYTSSFAVAITKPWINALQVRLVVDYARAAWLTLGAERETPAEVSMRSCPQDYQTVWYVQESALRRFTQGTQVVYTDWCDGAKDPTAFIDAGVAGLRGNHMVYGGYPTFVGSDLGILHSIRNETLLLPS
jgi:hypothetical protein